MPDAQLYASAARAAEARERTARTTWERSARQWDAHAAKAAEQHAQQHTEQRGAEAGDDAADRAADDGEGASAPREVADWPAWQATDPTPPAEALPTSIDDDHVDPADFFWDADTGDDDLTDEAHRGLGGGLGGGPGGAAVPAQRSDERRGDRAGGVDGDPPAAGRAVDPVGDETARRAQLALWHRDDHAAALVEDADLGRGAP